MATAALQDFGLFTETDISQVVDKYKDHVKRKISRTKKVQVRTLECGR